MFKGEAPLRERLVTIGVDTLLPHELTLGEAKFLLEITDKIVPVEQRLRELFRIPVLRKLETLPLETSGRISILGLSEGFLSPDTLDIYDRNDPAVVHLYAAPSSRAERNVKHWEKRFQNDKGRDPTLKERERYLRPGIQVLVLGHDAEIKEKLKKNLRERGFPISPYKGLSGIGPDRQVTIPDEIRNAKGSLYNSLIAYLTPSKIFDLVEEGKMSKELANRLVRNPKTKESYAYLVAKDEFERRLKERYPDADERQIQQLLKEQAVDIYTITP